MTYDGHEDRSIPWICVECSKVFRAAVLVVAGDESCRALLSESPPSTSQWLGKAGGDW